MLPDLTSIICFQDRGLQIGWTTVFLSEYAGPMFVYLWFYTRPWLAYGDLDTSSPPLSTTAHIAAAAWSVSSQKMMKNISY